MQLLCNLSCEGWITATVLCGPCQRTSCGKFRTLLQELSLKQRSEHITPILHEPHWLPAEMCIDCKILLHTGAWMAQPFPVPLGTNTLLPSSVSSAVLYPISSLHPSVDQGNNKKYFWVRAFSSAAPSLWNSLPITLREHSSKETVETYLFSEN